MPAPVTETVRFNVSVTTYKAADEKWMVQTVETGIVTYGATLEDAERMNGLANVRLVRAWKARGRLALDRFMKRHGIIDYTLDEQPGVEVPETNYAPVARPLDLAA